METAAILDLAFKGLNVVGILLVVMVLRPLRKVEERLFIIEKPVTEFGVHLPLLSGAILKLERSIEHQGALIPQVVADLAVLKEWRRNVDPKINQ